MRILLLTVDFPPGRGGVQGLLAEAAQGLADEELLVVTPRQDGDGACDARRRFRVLRTPAPRWPRWGGLLFIGARSLLEAWRFRPDVIICGHVLLGPVCWLVNAWLGIPYLLMAYAYEVRAPRMHWVISWGLRKANRVVTISQFTREVLTSFDFPIERIDVIRPGAISRMEAGDPPPNGTDLSSIGGHTLLSVSRLDDLYKGHDMVVRSLPLIRAKIPDVRYVIVGDGSLRGYLERLAKSLGVDDVIAFVGEASDEALDGWYRRCDLFILASRESATSGGAEGYGIVFIEAGLRGKPVIGGRSGGVPDAVVDGITGLLVDPRDTSAIADTVVLLLSDARLARKLGTQGRHRALEELSWPRFHSRFRTVLAQVANSDR